MNTKSLLVMAGAAILLTACYPSVHPFFTDKDVMYDARLVGEWHGKEESDRDSIWKFEKSGDQAYQLVVTEKENKEGKFNAHLFQLEGHLFLDIIPSECDYATNQADLVAFSMFPGHLLLRVSQIEPELKLAFCDFDWLKKHLEANPQALAHLQEEDRLLLTASTADLQRFVLAHLGADELFDDDGVMVRRQNEADAAEPK